MASYRHHSGTVKTTRDRSRGNARRRRDGWRSVHSVVGLVLCLAAAGGCSNASYEQLQGSWIGRPETTAVGSVAAASPDTTLEGVELKLEFLDTSRFVMTLQDEAGRLDRRQGRYRVERVYGPRWDLVLTAEEPAREVALEVVFDGDQRMTVQEVQGDSRLPPFVFERLVAAPSTQGSGAEGIEE